MCYNLDGLWSWGLKGMSLANGKEELLKFDFKTTTFDKKTAILRGTGDVVVPGITTFRDIYIDSNYLGHTAQDYQITIPRRAEFTLPIIIEVDMKNAYKNAMPALFGKEVWLKITGKVKLGKANVFKSFNVNYEGKQKFSL